MRFLYGLLALGGVSVLAGCVANNIPSQPYPETLVHEPELNKEHRVNMGEKMLTSGYGHYADCFTAKKAFTDSSGFGVVINTLNSGETLCKKYIDSNYYLTKRKNTNAGGQMISNPIRLVSPQADGAVTVCFNGCEVFRKNEYTLNKQWVLEESSFQQTIEYMGKSNDQLYFTYSETQGNMARPSFTRDFQVNMAEGSTLNYKGAVVDIMKASNEAVTYKVLRPFKGQ